MTDYPDALAKLAALRQDGFRPGATVVARGFANHPLILIHLALDSETLEPLGIVIDVWTSHIWTIRADEISHDDTQMAPEAINKRLSELLPFRRLSGEDKGRGPFDPRLSPINENLSGSVVRHRKGGIYTVFAAPGFLNHSPPIVYISHSDKVWWVRPWSEFGDDRFSPSSEHALGLDEIDMRLQK